MPEPKLSEDVVLEACQHEIGYTFKRPTLLRSALTHASGANHRLASNERLEFLGDAVLGFVVCDLLYRNYPEDEEGELTRIKSHVVSRRTCATLSRKLQLDDYLFLGKGMGGQAAPNSVLADVFESLLGAIYLDGGITAARRFLTKHLGPEIKAAVADEGIGNHKSHFQHVAQRQFGATPTYRLLDEKGPDHSKCFKIAAQVAGRHFPPAWGPTKKDAEQRAAMNALCTLSGDPVPFESD
jgi:ribonuclease-3